MSSYQMDNDHQGGKDSDAFTRLCIRSCNDDIGLRPWDCDRWWDSPAIEYVPDPPLQQGQQATIRVTINNFGTMDATSVFVEAVFNLWIGNEAQSNQPIGTTVLPLIAAGQHAIAEIPWTPPDSESTHACVHARVMDAYSLTTYPQRTLSWRARDNPQAANKNVTLIPIADDTQPVVLKFRAKNPDKLPRRYRAIGLVRNLRRRIRDSPAVDRRLSPAAGLDERNPLPFVPGRLVSEADVLRRGGLDRPDLARRRAVLDTRLSAASERRLWPRDDVNPRLVHSRFGFDLKGVLQAGDRERVTFLPNAAALARVELGSLTKLELAPDEERTLKFVIPPDQLPPRGRRRVFEIHFQTGDDEPVVHYVHLAR